MNSRDLIQSINRTWTWAIDCKFILGKETKWKLEICSRKQADGWFLTGLKVMKDFC